MVAPDANGERAGHVMSRAIQPADLTPGDLDHINAHATGTQVGDLAESKAIHNALGSILTVLALRDQTVAPTSTWTRWLANPARRVPTTRTTSRSTTRSDSADTTWRSPSAGTDPGPRGRDQGLHL